VRVAGGRRYEKRTRRSSLHQPSVELVGGSRGVGNAGTENRRLSCRSGAISSAPYVVGPASASSVHRGGRFAGRCSAPGRNRTSDSRFRNPIRPYQLTCEDGSKWPVYQRVFVSSAPPGYTTFPGLSRDRRGTAAGPPVPLGALLGVRRGAGDGSEADRVTSYRAVMIGPTTCSGMKAADQRGAVLVHPAGL